MGEKSVVMRPVDVEFSCGRTEAAFKELEVGVVPVFHRRRQRLYRLKHHSLCTSVSFEEALFVETVDLQTMNRREDFQELRTGRASYQFGSLLTRTVSTSLQA